MKTDRELLELAAKAAGVNVWTDIDGKYYSQGVGIAEAPWNPLTDDGDALRLAVKLRLCVDFAAGGLSIYRHGETDFIRFIKNEGDPYAATRRAIVRAAAAIGEAM